MPAVDKPDELRQEAWEYLVQFTWEHEGPVPNGIKPAKAKGAWDLR
jgi:hypothetical protein